MYNHAPPEYLCPFCLLVQGRESIESQLKLTDVFSQTEDITAFMATRKYLNSQGHVLIVTNKHFENIYDLPLALSSKLHSVSRDVALAMKAEYRCDGIMLRQHNEPAGDRHIWHYHLHVIPRYQNDDFHNSEKSHFEANERAQYAQKLKKWFGKSENKNTYDS
jgi:histidine triad (HIT) family protein